MRTQFFLILTASLLGLLLAGAALLSAPPAQAAPPAPVSQDILQPASVVTVTTFIVSNEGPGHLVDWLIAQGHGNDTLLQVLGYLKSQSGGVIPQAFYDQVAAAPPGSEVFTAQLFNYAGLVGGIEIAADGTISIPSVVGKDYLDAPGFATTSSLAGEFSFTYALDAARFFYTHSNEYGGGVTRDYYAFAIAWKGASNPMYLPLIRR